MEIEIFQFKDCGDIPNSRLALLVYRRAVEEREDRMAEAIEGMFMRNGWRPAWRWGVYSFPHYHSTAHEVLGVYRGNATLRLGHTTGVTAHVESGDIIVIPAGVGHQNLGCSDDFRVVGGYPDGQQADLLRGARGERPAADVRIARVPLPNADPVEGAGGTLIELWSHL